MKRSVLIQNNPHKVESDSAQLKTKDQSIVARNHRSFRSNHVNKRDKNIIRQIEIHSLRKI